MIPLPVNMAINLFSEKITAYDETKSLVNHEWMDARDGASGTSPM